MVNRSELKKLLPHGSKKLIAERAGVSVSAVSSYFNNRFSSEKIEIAALEVASEVFNKKKALLEQLNLS